MKLKLKLELKLTSCGNSGKGEAAHHQPAALKHKHKYKHTCVGFAKYFVSSSFTSGRCPCAQAWVGVWAVGYTCLVCCVLSDSARYATSRY